MNWLGFHTLSAALLFLLALPVILFYFLKLRRPRVEVPSLVLWRQVMRDRRVNSPFQRFKRNLLLLLQLLLLALVALAAMQPFWRGEAEEVERLPVLIDCSASMGALDAPGGRSRLAAALALARERVENLLPGQEMALLSFGRSARRLTGFTDNRRLLLAGLEDVEVQDVESNLEEGLRLCSALRRSKPFERVLLLTDGNLPAQVPMSLAYKVEVDRVPPAGPNLGITAFSAQREKGGAWLVFARIAGRSPSGAGVELLQEGDVIDRAHVLPPEGEGERVVFQLGWERAASLTLRLRPDGFDALAADNEAYLELPDVRSLFVHVDPELVSYRNALRAHDGVRLFPEQGSAGAGAQNGYDLVITAEAAGLERSAGVLFSTGVVPPRLQDLVRVETTGGRVVDWRRDAAVLQHVELRDLMLLDQPRSAPEVRAVAYEERDYEILVHGEAGPLLLRREAGEQVRYHALFHTDRSTLPYRIGFPILVANLLERARAVAGLDTAAAVRTGVLPPLPVGTAGTYRLVGPAGDEYRVEGGPDRPVSGLAARRAGTYRLIAEDGSGQTVRAALLSPLESGLAAVERIELQEFALPTDTAVAETDKPLWFPLACLGLLVLLVEWWYFQRRPGGYGRGGAR
jgi:hypothetical protein